MQNRVLRATAYTFHRTLTGFQLALKCTILVGSATILFVLGSATSTCVLRLFGLQVGDSQPIKSTNYQTKSKRRPLLTLDQKLL